MTGKWRYRDVEGALYRLGQPAEAVPSHAHYASPEGRVAPGPRPPSAPMLDRRLDVGITAKQVLDDVEIQDIRDHYILGIKRHGYKRRAGIIKKLVSNLNSAAETDN